MEQQVVSLLDTDTYKLKMQQRSFFFHPDTVVEWQFINRTPHFRLAEMINMKELRRQLEEIKALSYTSAELEYLRSLGIFKEAFLEFLKDFKLPDFELGVVDGQIGFRVEDKWTHSSPWEIYKLRTQSGLTTEVMMKAQGLTWEKLYKIVEQRALDFIVELKRKPRIRIIDFVCRRPLNAWWHKRVLEIFLNEVREMIVGTSSLRLAMEFGIPAIGTDAHESFMVLAGIFGLDDRMLRQSVQLEILEMEMLYGPEAYVDLSDTWGSKSYYRDLRPDQWRSHAGVRIDSGDPVAESFEEIQPRYKYLGINPKEKLFVPSDGLDDVEIFRLDDLLGDIHNLVNGVGGFFGNNVPWKKPITVMKATRANGIPLVKLSNTPGKAMGPDDYVSWFQRVFAS